MDLQHRVEILVQLGEHIREGGYSLLAASEKAALQNPWFTPAFVDTALQAIADQYLQRDKLVEWAGKYTMPGQAGAGKTVGIVMAGNIPAVGFHDLLCVFVSGHKALVKPSSKDDVLIRHLVAQMTGLDEQVQQYIRFAEQLKGCDAYIATGSSNTARYFDYYFGKYPSVIRRNRTSVAVLEGNETATELSSLADDIHLYFGMGCRNVTKLYVPADYDFIPLLDALKKYSHLIDFHKYRHNYDYQLSLHILNNKFYMTNESVLLVENPAVFAPISQVHFEYFSNRDELLLQLHNNQDIQCIVGHGSIPFGAAQIPGLGDYADGVDTMAFLTNLR